MPAASPVIQVMSDLPIGDVNEEIVHVFVSYAREDSRWLDPASRHNLVPFLADSLRRHHVAFWFDHDLKPGDEFRQQIKSKIDQSQIALLIVSQCFLNSAFIESEEMPRIAERAQQGQMIVVPVLVEPCDWSDYPFLADRQMVPSSPLIDYTDSDSSWAKVKYQILDGIKAQVKRIRELAETGGRRQDLLGSDLFRQIRPDPGAGAQTKQKTDGGVKEAGAQKASAQGSPGAGASAAGASASGSSTFSSSGVSASGASTSGSSTFGSSAASSTSAASGTSASSGGAAAGGLGTQKTAQSVVPKKYKTVNLTSGQKLAANFFFAGIMLAFLIIAIAVRVNSNSESSVSSSDFTSISDANAFPDNSTSLADTMQFIQNKMSDNRLSFTAYSTNTNDNSTFSNSYVELTSNVSADASACSVSYHFAEWLDNSSQADPDVDTSIPLGDVDSVTVESMHQNITNINANGGKSYIEVTSTDPDLTAVLVHRPPDKINELAFTDSSLAEGVAKAFVHAVSLCNGNATLRD